MFKISQKRGGSVPDKHVDMGPDKILDDVYGPYKEVLAKDWNKGFKELMKVDKFSTRSYMRHKTSVSHSINVISTLLMSYSDYSDYATMQWLETMDV
jgi:hypothetical protein